METRGAHIDFTCSLSPEDFVAAYRLHIKPRPAFSFLGTAVIFLCGLLFLDAVLGGFSGKVGRALLVILVSGSGAHLWYSRFFIPRMARRAHAHAKFLHGLQRVLVDDAGVQLHTDYINLLQPWAHFVSWKESGNVFLLYESDLMFSLLFPKRCMDEASIDGLRGVLSSKVSPKS